LVTGLMRAKTEGFCAWASFALLISRSRFLEMVSSARSRKRSSISRRITPKPQRAKTWAMPLPMVPAPRTATVRIASGFKGELQSEKTKLQQNHEEVTKSRLTGSDGSECTAKRALPISKTPSLVLRSAKAGLQSSSGGYSLTFDADRADA